MRPQPLQGRSKAIKKIKVFLVFFQMSYNFSFTIESKSNNDHFKFNINLNLKYNI
jgi:hypothetical protein